MAPEHRNPSQKLTSHVLATTLDMLKLFERLLQSIAQSPALSYPHLYLGYHCLDCILQRRALLVDRGNHRAHGHTDIDHHGLGQLKVAVEDCTISTVDRSLGKKPHCGKCVPYVKQLLRQVVDIASPQPMAVPAS
jgi:bacterioferritin-associated ferredoxin